MVIGLREARLGMLGWCTWASANDGLHTVSFGFRDGADFTGSPIVWGVV